MPDKSLRFLVVDDFPTMRRIMKSVLNELGFASVDEAADGAEALEKLRECAYGFVVCDWHMPRMDGLALLQAIRADAALKSLPVLLVTAAAKKAHIAAATEAGANGIIVKPFTAATLRDKLDRIFERLAA